MSKAAEPLLYKKMVKNGKKNFLYLEKKFKFLNKKIFF